MTDAASVYAPNPSFSGIERRRLSGADPVAVLLHRMHVEMIALAEGVMAVQAAMSPLFAAHAATAGESIRESQRLDLIEQTLRALAEIATHASVSSEAGPLDLDDITKLCRLSDLAERLRGGAQTGAGSDGAVELF